MRTMMISLAASVALLSGCDQAEPPAAAATFSKTTLTEPVRDRAAEVITPFKQKLMATLGAALKESPAHAIDVCQLEAPMIAAALNQDGLRIGRSSHRVRNPGNAPSPWQEAAISHYLNNPDDRAPQVYHLDNEHVGYAEPIIAMPMCLTCHGSELSPEVQAALAEKYPQDQATGFADGELRGIFWVEMPQPNTL